MKPRLMPAALAASLLAWVPAQGETVAPSDVEIVDLAVEASLTGAAGDAEKGRAWFLDRKLGNCLACHMNSDMADQPFHGEVGTPLDGVGDRWSAAELRAILVNSKEVFGPDTIMPAFYRDSGFHRVAEEFEGKTILTAEQVEDVIAYLLTLKE